LVLSYQEQRRSDGGRLVYKKSLTGELRPAKIDRRIHMPVIEIVHQLRIGGLLRIQAESLR
jgi:hypothetical protein